jgi:hypothetical protein
MLVCSFARVFLGGEVVDGMCCSEMILINKENKRTMKLLPVLTGSMQYNRVRTKFLVVFNLPMLKMPVHETSLRVYDLEGIRNLIIRYIEAASFKGFMTKSWDK